jgi:hypothetical protein
MSEVPSVPALVDDWLEWCAWISDPKNESAADCPTGQLDFIEAVVSHPERAWEAILKLVEDSRARQFLGYLAAGPVEDLLSLHGAQFIARIEAAARPNSIFAGMLDGVWQCSMPDEIWSRVQAVKGHAITESLDDA